MEKLSGVMISFRNFTFQGKWASDCVGIKKKKKFPQFQLITDSRGKIS